MSPERQKRFWQPKTTSASPENERATTTRDLHNKFVTIGPAVPEICSRTDRHTERQTDRNTPLPYRGGVKSTLKSLICYHIIMLIYYSYCGKIVASKNSPRTRRLHALATLYDNKKITKLNDHFISAICSCVSKCQWSSQSNCIACMVQINVSDHSLFTTLCMVIGDGATYRNPRPT